MKKLKSGFTLIELMVVISVIAILSTIALFGLRAAQNAAKDTKKISTIMGVKAALERYYGDQGTAAYPVAATWAALITGLGTYYTAVPTGDSVVTGCGGATCALSTAPCVVVDSTAQAYTITFCKSGGGSAVYTQPQ
jgi:prepilin-type N-terminal cleavage/methylation domain-containing protein